MRGRYLGWAAWIAIMAFTSLRVDNAAHISGLVAGALIGLVVRRRADTAGWARRAWSAGAVAGIALVLVAYASAATTKISPDVLREAREQHDDPDLSP
jgi:peptidoglycan/LPS O-acetylase OafA/YrhL